MERCEHVNSLVNTSDLTIYDPTGWQCSVCGTTEWVWACLSCSNIACGRLNEQHAEQHYETTKHPVAIEINEKYVYCYVCDEYIVGDNDNRDIERVRASLTEIGTMSTQEDNSQQVLTRERSDEDDMNVTAICHYRKTLLGKIFGCWQSLIQQEKVQKHELAHQPPMLTRSRASLFHAKRRTLIPGVTGLRNLGNTCYINSILQSLGHLDEFREYFCQLVFGLFSPSGTPLPGSSPLATRQLQRLNTIDFFQHLNYQTTPGVSPLSSLTSKTGSPGNKKSEGLNGGGSNAVEHLDDLEASVGSKTVALSTLSLCQELHGLLRVLWSGKWAQVSPHGFLHAIWKYIPAFKGHLQHDAQEFLCELLDKVSQEIEQLPQCTGAENIVDQIFRGMILSQVTCQSCKNISARREPFLDLSLEFPRCFQYTGGQIGRNMCHLTEMLSTFTEVEELEPLSYICDHCNRRLRRSSRKGELRTNATKQLLISSPPVILRLHLKRFRWCGRNHREKINTHVAFDEELDISPFCLSTPTNAKYKLNGVVVHHGAGFKSGHYTAYTYNSCAETWLHCNDARVQLVSMEDVLKSQAYILFYTQETATVNLDVMPLLPEESDSSSSLPATVCGLDKDCLATLRQLTPGQVEHVVDDEVTLSFHRDPALLKRVSEHSFVGLSPSGDGEKPAELPLLLKASDEGSSMLDNGVQLPASDNCIQHTAYDDSIDESSACQNLIIESLTTQEVKSPVKQLNRSPCLSPSFQQLTNESSGNLDFMSPKKLDSESPSIQLASESPSKQLASESPSKQLASESPSKQLASESPSNQLASESPSKQLASESPSKQLASESSSKQSDIISPLSKKPTRESPRKSNITSPPIKKTSDIISISPNQSVSELPSKQHIISPSPGQIRTSSPCEPDTSSPSFHQVGSNSTHSSPSHQASGISPPKRPLSPEINDGPPEKKIDSSLESSNLLTEDN